MRLLLDKEKIKKYRSISDFAPVNKVDNFIQEAQTVELRSVLGKELWAKVVEDISPLNYPALDAVIEPMLAYYAYARYLSVNQVSATAFGVVQKTSDFSQQINEKTLMRVVGQAREMAKVYEQDLIDFLNENADDYPEWKRKCAARSKNVGAIKISVAGDKEDYPDFVKDQVNKGLRRNGIY